MDERLRHALDVARLWRRESASVGETRRAAVGALQAARERPDATGAAIAGSAGHAAATARLADHSLGAAWYALKAVASVGAPIEAERRWQDRQPPPQINDLVLAARKGRPGHA